MMALNEATTTLTPAVSATPIDNPRLQTAVGRHSFCFAKTAPPLRC